MGTARKLLLQMSCYGALLSGIPEVAAQSAATIMVAKEAPLAESGAQPKASAVSELPDSPGAMVSKSQSVAQSEYAGTLSGRRPSIQLLSMSAQSDFKQSESGLSQAQTTPALQSPAQTPVGTAAAGVIPADGIAASQPAGVAIAPARQRRVRTIVLRMGAIVGAGVAVGSVVALTQATPSKPPGAH